MNSNKETNYDHLWYAVQTRSNKENDVFKSLVTLDNVEVYLPFNRFLMFWGDKQKWIIKPLFPNLIFIKTHSSKTEEIINIPHVKNFIQRKGKPIEIPFTSIQFIKKVIATKENFETRKFRISKGEKIVFDHGPLRNIDLNFINYAGQQKIAVNIPFINYAILIDKESTLLRYYDEFVDKDGLSKDQEDSMF